MNTFTGQELYNKYGHDIKRLYGRKILWKGVLYIFIEHKPTWNQGLIVLCDPKKYQSVGDNRSGTYVHPWDTGFKWCRKPLKEYVP